MPTITNLGSIATSGGADGATFDTSTIGSTHECTLIAEKTGAPGATGDFQVSPDASTWVVPRRAQDSDADGCGNFSASSVFVCGGDHRYIRGAKTAGVGAGGFNFYMITK